jgi:hypothetical protein
MMTSHKNKTIKGGKKSQLHGWMNIRKYANSWPINKSSGHISECHRQNYILLQSQFAKNWYSRKLS